MTEQQLTRGQIEDYLARILQSSRDFRIKQFEHGWVCRPIPGPDEAPGLGLMNLVVDSTTEVVHEYPSWSMERVAEDYSEAIRRGTAPTGAQIYPPRWRVTIQQTRENRRQITYRLDIESLAEPTTRHLIRHLEIDKHTAAYRPENTISACVNAWTRRRSKADGSWPNQGILEY